MTIITGDNLLIKLTISYNSR